MKRCECTEPGFCARYQKRMFGHMFDICRGAVLTPAECDRYRKSWASQEESDEELVEEELISAAPKGFEEGFLFRSYNQLREDIIRWLDHLPPIKAVAGIPRSGLIPAAMISFERQIPLIPIESLTYGQRIYRPYVSRPLNHVSGPVLVIDDTSWSGRTMELIKSHVRSEDAVFAAVYSSAQGAKTLDFHGYELRTANHSFGWNLFRDSVTERIATDMDGVLCRDYGGPDEDRYPERYSSWLDATEPLIRNTRRIHAIVTGRLEQHREQTERWLAGHGIQYEKLLMGPWNSAAERGRAGVAQYKANTWTRQLPLAKVFIESCPHQAREISQLTRRPVMSFSDQVVHSESALIPSWDTLQLSK